jgi:hypothetical protein
MLCARGWLARRQSADILAGRRVRPVRTTSVAGTGLPSSFPVDRAPCPIRVKRLKRESREPR